MIALGPRTATYALFQSHRLGKSRIGSSNGREWRFTNLFILQDERQQLKTTGSEPWPALKGREKKPSRTTSTPTQKLTCRNNSPVLLGCVWAVNLRQGQDQEVGWPSESSPGGVGRQEEGLPACTQQLLSPVCPCCPPLHSAPHLPISWFGYQP